MQEETSLIEVNDLVKKYGDHTAVDGISFKTEKGHVYGFLGPNGAGKSTTMNIITGCLAATSGSVSICGHDIFEEPTEAKKHIGYLPELPPVYGDMTPYEYLCFVAKAKKVPSVRVAHDVKEVMETTYLTSVSDRLIQNLSKGYRQRVGIAQAMLGDPDIIILDEPTVGLDPKQILEIRELIKKLGETKTVILSSHILAEISAVCDHIMIISHGRLVACDTIENLEAEANRETRFLISAKGEPSDIIAVIEAVDGVNNVYLTEDGDYEIEFEPECDAREDIFFAMAKNGYPIVSMQYEKHTLEDIFLSLTDDSLALEKLASVPDDEEEDGEEGENVPEPEEDSDYTPLFGSSVSEDENKESEDDKQ